MQRREGTIMHTLLNDNSQWRFWKKDWSYSVQVVWDGKTKFKDIVKSMKKRLGGDMMYERAISIKAEKEIVKFN